MKKKIKTISGVVLIFFIGAVCGGVVVHIFYKTEIQKYATGDAGVYQKLILKNLTWRLELDAGQREKVLARLENAHCEIQSVRKQYRPQIQDILEKSRRQIRSELKGEQVEKFDRLVKEYRQDNVAKANP